MTHAYSTRFTRMSAAAVLGFGSLAGVACRSAETLAAAPASAVTNAAAASTMPFAVNCGPGQQALIRPGVAAGQAISQVDCVAVPSASAAYASLDGDPRLAGAPLYPAAVRPVRYSPMPSGRAPVRRVARGRSITKSVLVIGSSAGIGAGVGAAVKGKRGALIGAAIGGGAATIWDQVTRRDRQ